MIPRFAQVESTGLVHHSTLPALFRRKFRLEEAVAESPTAAAPFFSLNRVQALIDLHYDVNEHVAPSRRR